MLSLKDVAQQARFAAMQPGQITRHLINQDADLRAFERAVQNAREVIFWRSDRGRQWMGSRPQAAAAARAAARIVREIALQSEIELARRADAHQADRAMLGILLGASA